MLFGKIHSSLGGGGFARQMVLIRSETIISGETKALKACFASRANISSCNIRSSAFIILERVKKKKALRWVGEEKKRKKK